MMTPITSIARLARQTRAISVPLLVAGALAAGCGTAQAPAPGTASGSSASGSSASSGASSSPKPTPVPTVTGGATVAGQPACVDWPAKAARVKLPATFKPVVVERCVTSFQHVPGKGEWQTATLEKATKNLGPLITALLRPPARHTPGTVCPDLVMLPPQIAVIDAAGKTLIPVLPLSGCGQVQSQVLAAIAALDWQPVSVRLVAPIPQSASGNATSSGAVKAGSLKTIQTLPAVAP